MDTAEEETGRRWGRVVLGAVLLVVGVALHGVAAAHTASTDLLAENVLVEFAQRGWVRLAAWAAVAGGALLAVRGWSPRRREPSEG